MSRSPVTPSNLDHLKREAKALLRRHQRGDPSTCETLRLHHRFRESTPEQILSAPLSLQEAQHALALSYGFSGWTHLKAHVRKEAEVADKVRETVSVFTAKGPARDSTGSAWDERRSQGIADLAILAGADFRVLEEVATSKRASAREMAAVALAHSKDPRALERLEPLLRDRAVGVRKAALRGMAARIHPNGPPEPAWGWGLALKAERVPEEAASLVPLVDDKSVHVRKEAVCALAAYVHLDDSRIEDALAAALRDESHTVQHAAARATGQACPGCGNRPVG